MTRVATAEVTTPRARDVLRRWPFWIAVAVIAIAAAIIAFVTGGTASQGVPLAPTNAAPGGARALAEVLRAQGVDIIVPDQLDEAITAAPGATLLLHDPDGILDEAALDRLETAGAARVVLVDPHDSVLMALAPEVMPSGGTAEPAQADCGVPLVERAGTIAGESRLYRVTGDAQGCWGAGGDDYRVAVADGGRLIVTGTTGALSNEQIVLAGNAAFALGLLGEHERLVWFHPTLADAATSAPPTIGSLSPAWVVPFALLGVAVFLAAAVWRGRRLGALVVEPLPAVVRADETMRGRARLYAHAGARLRAADALRLGALDRIAGVLGLPSSATVDAIADAVAALLGRPRSALLALLRDEEPRRDRELVRLANDLRALELEVRETLGRRGGA